MESNRLREDGFSAAASASEAAVVACGVEREVIGRDDDASAMAATVKRQSVNGGSEAEVNLRSRSGSVKGEEQVIRWERFLPRRFLRVLLVENDDSTRHIVAALLRKCSYQVAAVADGLKAWDILKERHFNFDLVLTEVVMPSLSGIGLLSKIMSNEICKNIPVIMMSSHDSVGIVFKCMLKGAADFLVKPVRKNELRNLWQHVWRKCSSTNYGNGLENGNLNHMKVEGVSENETASNHGSANDGGRSKTGESSHAGSDTQSSCSKPDTEIGSMQKQGEPLETEKRNFSMEVDSKSDEQETDRTEIALLSIPENVIIKDKSKELEIKVTLSIRTALSSEKVNEENASFVRSPYRENDQADMLSKSNENNGPEILDQQKAQDLPSDKVNEFIRTETTQRYGHQFSEDNGIRDDVLCVSSKSFNVNGRYSWSSPLLELSLRRPELNGSDEVSQDKHVLKRSHASAFSRYGKASIHQKPSPLSSVSCIKADDSGSSNCQIRSSADKGQKSPFPSIERSNSSHGIGSEPLERQLSSGSNKEDVGPSSSFPAGENAGFSSTEKTFSPRPQLGCVPFSIPVGAIPFQSFSGGYGAVLHPVIYTEHLVPESSSPEVRKEIELIPSKPTNHNSCHVFNNPHVNCHVYEGSKHPHKLTQTTMEQRANAETAFPRFHLHSPVENANLSGNYNCGITIASGSNGSYEDTSVAANAATAFENSHEDGFQQGNVRDGFQNSSGKDADSDRSRREAALTKFRLKRKDRCFEKKVRYHNRKKLAEQRPRLKGQFVRQAVAELNTIAAELDD